MDTPQQRLQTAFCKNDIAAVRALLTENPDLKKLIHAPIAGFETFRIKNVRSR
jgi:hypothetical protein